MKLFCHVLYSWLLAIAVMLFGLFIYGLMTMPYIPSDFFSPELLVIPFSAMLVALPSLLLSLLFLRFIQITQYTVLERFFLWCLAALIAVLLNIVFVALLFAPEEINPDTFLSFWPAYAAVILSLSFRYKYFLLLNAKPVEN